jgi:hypothetical protein
MQSSGESRRENAGARLSTVIARSNATKQSRAPGVALDCFASLAMTVEGLRIPRTFVRRRPYDLSRCDNAAWVPAFAGRTGV